MLISPDDLAQLEGTIEVLSDPAALADIREADAAYDRGDVLVLRIDHRRAVCRPN